jgi:hypothetical protein
MRGFPEEQKSSSLPPKDGSRVDMSCLDSYLYSGLISLSRLAFSPRATLPLGVAAIAWGFAAIVTNILH